ncbi:MAG: carbamoyltransferase HypF [Bacteroidetes bacterium HGW-Bacteroidetes-2]|jgi:hydrogenase maturation protein HypF|nr:MAG: carbamoyltransferase HypF [Bacteroidetes bacterium HGW-Bacteroidetes-2]
MQKTYKIGVSGQVQGVGFRPFVYALALQFNLKGTVSNTEEGVNIFVSGLKTKIQPFYTSLIENPPEVSKISKSFFKEIPYISFDDFKIIVSPKVTKLNLQLTPDFAICENCRKELSDSTNRRYQYPFITCVHCGPRWAITKNFPFERHNTSIKMYRMCKDCKMEYANPENRRFHSQTNSCSNCGFHLSLTNATGLEIDFKKNNVFEKVAHLLKQGNIIAIKNSSGYLLCCDAANVGAIHRLRRKKNRPNKPFAVLYPSLSLLKKHASINVKQQKALTSAESPIVILPINDFKGKLALTELVPKLNHLGVMLPYSGILQLLANKLNIPIVATSGNLHGSPILSDQKEASPVLNKMADYFLHHNLEICNAQDDSVLKISNKFQHKVLFRRSRGYAPNYFGKIPKSKEIIMAMGGHLKSTICFLPNDFLYISQYLGDLDNFDVYKRFTETADKFLTLFQQKPDIILTDLHPEYQSTQFGIEFAIKWQANHFKIQHHKAHFTSVLGEHNLFNKQVLGVIWDGTGYGDDGQIWGGEFFNYQSHKIDRLAHFDYFNWLAGDKMAQMPKLSLFSLADIRMKNEVESKFSNQELSIYASLIKINTLKTSSVGRLFDAVASLLGICDSNSYEGEAAILLENYGKEYDLKQCKSYCSISENNNIPTKKLLKNLYDDWMNGTSKENVVVNFMYTLASIVFQMADRVHYKNIAFSGGVFQNTTLIDMLKEMAGNQYKLFFNSNLAPNDENISFGQMMYYLHNINTISKFKPNEVKVGLAHNK